MNFLLKMGTFHCYVSLPEGSPEDLPSQKESSLATLIFQGRAVKLRVFLMTFLGVSTRLQSFMSLFFRRLKVKHHF